MRDVSVVEGNILLWKQSTDSQQLAGKGFGQDPDDEGSECWKLMSVLLNASRSAIYDIAWSPDGKYIASASSLDNSVNVYEVIGKKIVYAVKSHTHIVQGIAWDPLNQFLASQSSDRSVNFYQIKRAKDLKLTVINRSSRLEDQGVSVQAPTAAIPKSVDDETAAVSGDSKEQPRKKYKKLYLDENFVTFFRRLSFSPDGSLVFAPTGLTVDHHHQSERGEPENCVYIYARNRFNNNQGPIACYPGFSRPATAIRCCPKLFTLRDGIGMSSGIQLPYRMLVAVATRDTVLVYDTQRSNPIIHLSNFHYSAITDLTWFPLSLSFSIFPLSFIAIQSNKLSFV
jgi:chromatin assembly factor 1 subunit B